MNITISGRKVDQVKQFTYLGSVISNDAYSTREIKTRIALAKNAFSKHSRTLTAKKLKQSLRKRLVKCLVWSVALYASETWTIKKAEERRIDSLEMWLSRRMEGISWKDRVTNDEVLNRVNEVRILRETIRRRKKNWLGHILRGNNMLRDVLEGKMKGKRGRGRPRIGMVSELKEAETYESMKRKSQDREQWRNY